MRRLRAFTLIELLVVVAIIALLISILIPSLSRARDQAKKVKCQANLRSIGHALVYYMDDSRDIFPYAQYYGCIGYIGRAPVQMALGSQVPAGQRPMNSYLDIDDNPMPDQGPQVTRQRNSIVQCPSDRGDPWSYPAPFSDLQGKFFIEHGASYSYASDARELPPLYRPPPDGILSCRDLRLAEVRRPEKKIVFQEPVFSRMLDPKDPRSQWHHTGRPHANLLFADGHVSFEFTRIRDPENDPDEQEFYTPDENKSYY